MRSTVVAVIAVGCGAAAPQPTRPPPPPEATDPIIDHLRAYRDDMCACKSHACESLVEQELVQWDLRSGDADKRATSPEAHQLDAQLRACARVAELGESTPASRRAHALRELNQLATEMCACANPICASFVASEKASWPASNDERAQFPDPPNAEEAEAIQRYADCETKAKSGGQRAP